MIKKRILRLAVWLQVCPRLPAENTFPTTGIQGEESVIRENTTGGTTIHNDWLPLWRRESFLPWHVPSNIHACYFRGGSRCNATLKNLEKQSFSFVEQQYVVHSLTVSQSAFNKISVDSVHFLYQHLRLRYFKKRCSSGVAAILSSTEEEGIIHCD